MDAHGFVAWSGQLVCDFSCPGIIYLTVRRTVFIWLYPLAIHRREHPFSREATFIVARVEIILVAELANLIDTRFVIKSIASRPPTRIISTGDDECGLA